MPARPSDKERTKITTLRSKQQNCDSETAKFLFSYY
jgi:hypothetical protein